MKKCFVFIILLVLFLPVEGQKTVNITILHTNDLHSRLIGYAPESDYSPLIINNDNTVGGFARIATIIKSEKERNEGITLAIDAGDYLMGTLFPSVEKTSGFQLRLMKTMGYDVLGSGNHEFDYGPETFAKIISSSAHSGEIPALLLSNAEFCRKDTKDDALEQEFADNLIKNMLVIEKNGVRIGLFSVLGKSAGQAAPRATPLIFENSILSARTMVRKLKTEKCDIIICLSHSGLKKDKNGKWDGEDAELARKVKGIDLIISGHTHTVLDKPLIINSIPIVQTGDFGQYVGRLSMTLSDNTLKLNDYKLISVNDSIEGDATVDSLINEQKTKVSDIILKPLLLDYRKPLAETDFKIEGNDVSDYLNSNLGPLVADAIYDYVNIHNSKGTDISIVSAGMIFDKILPGIQTVPDIFKIMPLGSGNNDIPGYPLSRLYVTGKELKSILEVLLMAYKSSPENYCYYSGFKAEYNPEKGFLKKISKIEIVSKDGKLKNVDFSRKSKELFSITANSYMLGFIGIIKKMSFGLVNVVPKDYNGNKVTDLNSMVIDFDENRSGLQEGKEWLALVEFLSLMKDTNGNGIPDINKKYSVPVRCLYQVK